MIKFLITVLLFIAAGSTCAQDNNNIVEISLSSIQDTSIQNYFTIFINIDIKQGWHLNSNKPFDDYLTPTSINQKDTSGIKIVKVEYPPEMITKLPFSESDMSLYEGMVTIKVVLEADNSLISKKKNVELELEYQSCNNQTCLFPVQKILTVAL
jgi:hypothetical protein